MELPGNHLSKGQRIKGREKSPAIADACGRGEGAARARRMLFVFMEANRCLCSQAPEDINHPGQTGTEAGIHGGFCLLSGGDWTSFQGSGEQLELYED